jgi:hypothetical protein
MPFEMANECETLSDYFIFCLSDSENVVARSLQTPLINLLQVTFVYQFYSRMTTLVRSNFEIMFKSSSCFQIIL